MQNYDTVIFDLDGTLLNTLEDLTDSVNYAMEKYGYPVHTLDEVRRFVGNGLKKLMERALPADVSEEEFKRVFDDFCTHYGKNCAIKTRPYDGILELLDELNARGIKLAIVSNKGDFAVQELRDLYFKGRIKVAIGEKSGICRKPAPDTAFEAMRRLDSDSAHSVYVGDSDVDIETAKNAGLSCISVTWGFRDRAFLKEHGAQHYADTPQDILDFLKENKYANEAGK